MVKRTPSILECPPKPKAATTAGELDPLAFEVEQQQVRARAILDERSKLKQLRALVNGINARGGLNVPPTLPAALSSLDKHRGEESRWIQYFKAGHARIVAQAAASRAKARERGLQPIAAARAEAEARRLWQQIIGKPSSGNPAQAARGSSSSRRPARGRQGP